MSDEGYNGGVRALNEINEAACIFITSFEPSFTKLSDRAVAKVDNVVRIATDGDANSAITVDDDERWNPLLDEDEDFTKNDTLPVHTLDGIIRCSGTALLPLSGDAL